MKDKQPEFSFCESLITNPRSAWHIRKLTEVGRKLGGGADTKSLCNRKIRWDLDVKINEHHLEHACTECVRVFKEYAEARDER